MGHYCLKQFVLVKIPDLLGPSRGSEIGHFLVRENRRVPESFGFGNDNNAGLSSKSRKSEIFTPPFWPTAGALAR